MPVQPSELMKQVRRIRIATARLVTEQFAGAYHSAFRGQGIEFHEVREYQAGDDIRTIDWNVTARMGRPFVKRFAEERELTLLFLADISGSQAFGSRNRTKAERTAEITGLLALSAALNQDKVGLILFSDRIVRYLKPARSRTAVLRLVREVLAAEETRHGTDIAGALRFACQVQKRRAILFLISDFMDHEFEKPLLYASRRHDLIACPIVDPREEELPPAGLLECQDPETGRTFWLDATSASVRHRFREAARDRQTRLDALFARLGIDTIRIRTDEPFAAALHAFFAKRLKRLGKGL